MLNPIFEMLGSRAIQNIPDMLGYLSWLKSWTRLKFTKLRNLATLVLFIGILESNVLPETCGPFEWSLLTVFFLIQMWMNALTTASAINAVKT